MTNAEAVNVRAVVSRRGRWYRPEVALARGPAVEGEPGDGSFSTLYGTVWALVLDVTRGLMLWRHDGPDWGWVAPLTPLPKLPREARHVALAFDQNARPVLAWEQADGVRLRYWDALAGAVVTIGPWEGCDPCLLNDAEVHYQPAQSDLVLAYLTPDRLTLTHRVQRELYADEHAAATSGAPLYLDQLAAAPYFWQALAGNAAGQ
ncbi:MAG TPA: hypothetical protein VHN99_05910, partial [Deinococcales bacterium]|nr:hypothetical protein [Deinococcales bacterium]